MLTSKSIYPAALLILPIRDVAVAVANVVTMAVAVVIAELVDLVDEMAVGASMGVPALGAGDRDARLGRTAVVEGPAASLATGWSTTARRDQQGCSFCISRQ